MGVSVSGLAQMMGVQGQTVRAWVREGKVPFHRSPSNRAFFTDEDIQAILNQHNTCPATWAYYARSSCDSTTALNNQTQQLKDAYGDTPEYIITDRASGLNEKRKGLHQILNLAKQHKITDLAITTQDRLTRFGYTYLEKYLQDNNVTIHCLQGTTEKQPEQELIDDFMALLASFSGRYYHLRSTKNQQRFIKEAENRTKQHNTTNTTEESDTTTL